MDFTLVNLALVAIGGAVGALLRFSVGQVVDSSQFPWATFVVNVIGSFLLALISFSYSGLSLETRLFLFTGLFGAFTTMSTFSLETTQLLFDGRTLAACLNIVLNVVLCVGGAVLGKYASAFLA